MPATTTPCRHWDNDHPCGNPNTRNYLTGPRCSAHTPAATADKPETTPDPNRTLTALRATAGTIWSYKTTDTALNDQRAIATGKRRSTPAQYRAATQQQ